MNHDREGSDVVATGKGADGSPGMNVGDGASIRLWRSPSQVWPAYPTVAVVRAVSRLRRGAAQRKSRAIGGLSIFLDRSKMGDIAPEQMKVYLVSPGEHDLSVHFLGGLRRSRKLSVALAEGEEKQFVCFLNGIAWPTIRSATADDVAAMERSQSPPAHAPDRA